MSTQISKDVLQERSVNRMVNSDGVVNSVSHCKNLSQLTIWLTVCHLLTDLLTYIRSA